MSATLESLTGLCVGRFGRLPISSTPLSGGGGDRQYFRLSFSDGESVVGAIADNLRDSRSFVSLSAIFRAHGVPVPEVYAFSENFDCYLQQDLGDVSLFSTLSYEGTADSVADALKALVTLQTVPESEWESAVSYKPFSCRQVLWDLNYFKYEFLKNVLTDFDEDKLEDDFELLSHRLVSRGPEFYGFMMRDCQSRNVMLAPTPYFIDFQGGRRGPCIYDAVSFLWQAKAAFPKVFRDEMLRLYVDGFCRAKGLGGNSGAEMLSSSAEFILFRTLQVLGAYGFRGLVQKRAHFLGSIPGALRNLEELLSEGIVDAYPELKEVCCQLVASTRFAPQPDGGLRVKVFSFSYKRGYPEDFSGNGGGFMFDCRGMHNPGRYDEYKQLTGRDKPVIDFLKAKGEADIFAARAFEMVSPSVKRYLKRGFNSLQIGFGCTGGRHRSVYCAERVARMLCDSFPDAKIELIHREQGIREVLSNEDGAKAV